MAKNGDVFIPDYYLLNEDEGLIYRKEQFKDKESCDAEYVIADKRYTLSETKDKLEQNGLRVVESRYVRANQWKNEPRLIDAKEILFVVTK